MHLQSRCVVLGLLVGLLSVTTRAVQAQPARTRTLVYEPVNKEWEEIPPPQPGTPAGELHSIRMEIKEGKYRRALSGIKKFVEKYGPSDPTYPEVLIAKAEAMIGRREYYKAHVTLQEFLGEFAGTAMTSEAIRLEFVIAEAYLAGAKRKLLGVGLLSGEDVAYRILDEISSDYADTPIAELALKTKADHMFARGDHGLAELEYARLLQEYPRSRYHPFSLRRSADAALASFGGVDFDEAALIEAEDRYGEYRLRYPGRADRDEIVLILDGIRETRAEKDFSVGAYYERTAHLSSAIFYYQSVRKDWPETIAATKARARLELLGALEPAIPAETSTAHSRTDVGA